MAVKRENYIDVDLRQNCVSRTFANVVIGEGDTKGDRFGVRVFDGGEPADMLNTVCTGYFIRPDGITLVIGGEVSANLAYVILPAAAYAKEGKFTLAIKASGENFATTLRIVDGVVAETTTGDVSDPTGTIPSLEELLAVIADAEAAVETIAGFELTASIIEGTRYKISISKEA